MADYLASPDAVFKDNAEWRYGKPPDYTKTRQFWKDTKSKNHAAGSLEEIVENLVKNWEVEASFKPRLEDWRTIDREHYSFAINGGEPQTAEHMLKVGTYNAILAADSPYYSPKYSDFNSSHKTFKRMMPAFAWEVLEVYSGPPKVAFLWRHWGEMKSDYIGFNDKGEKVTVKAKGQMIDIQGITIAHVNEQVQLQKVDTYFDPATMFRQIAPDGIVNTEVVDHKVESATETDAPESPSSDDKTWEKVEPPVMEDQAAEIASPAVNNRENASSAINNQKADSSAINKQEVSASEVKDQAKAGEKSHALVGEADKQQIQEGELPSTENESSLEVKEKSTVTNETLSLPSQMEEKVKPEPGEAVAVPSKEAETRATHAEMSNMSVAQCPFFNQE